MSTQSKRRLHFAIAAGSVAFLAASLHGNRSEFSVPCATRPWIILSPRPASARQHGGMTVGHLIPANDQRVGAWAALQNVWKRPHEDMEAEWDGNYPLSLKSGLSADIANATGDGRRPEGIAEKTKSWFITS